MYRFLFNSIQGRNWFVLMLMLVMTLMFPSTADAGKIDFLQGMAKMAETRGGGPARFHDTASSAYTPSPERGFDFALTGADIITD